MEQYRDLIDLAKEFSRELLLLRPEVGFREAANAGLDYALAGSREDISPEEAAATFVEIFHCRH
jgi:hypothetical protein